MRQAVAAGDIREEAIKPYTTIENPLVYTLVLKVPSCQLTRTLKFDEAPPDGVALPVVCAFLGPSARRHEFRPPGAPKSRAGLRGLTLAKGNLGAPASLSSKDPARPLRS